MNALELISTMEAQRSSWKLVAAHSLSRRQLLWIADVLRARLLNDRRQRMPTLYENCVQQLPMLPAVKSSELVFGPNEPVTSIGPIPEPIISSAGPGFTFIGPNGGEGLDVVTRARLHFRRYSRQNRLQPCALWDPAQLTLFFNEAHRLLPPKRRIEGVFMHPMEAAHFTAPGQAPALVAEPFDFEYPLPSPLADPLLKMVAEYEKLTNLLPPDLQNDDQPNANAGTGAG